MTDVIGGVFSQAKFVIPVLIVLLFNALVNLERKERSYQIFMPIVTLAYVYVLYFSSTSIGELINSLIRKITSGQEVKGYFLFTIVNIVSILIYFAWKRAVIRLFKNIFSKGNPIHDRIAEKFYEHNAEDNIWYLKENMVQVRRFLKIIYYAILIVSCLIAMVVCYAVKSGLMDDLFYPIIPVLIFGEVYAFFNGLSKSEDSMQVAAENSKSERRANYALLRPVLSQMFGDKLIAEDTTINNSSF